VPLRALVPAFGDDEARALGIVSSVAAFKTSHACCEGRVANIHRISDLLRGVVIPPDGTFSVNDLIGPRTKAKGFVAAPVITNHEHDTAVGGGISQFATTLFNAAFFAGLDLVEYQSHSLYISRYPYGREATLSYPAPDLKLHNPTSHGVLIWPTYTDTSLSVALYSTPWFRSVTQGAQRKTSRGTCTVVETPRTRVLPDGRPVTDVISAVYHQEGQPCSGGRPHVQ
jgi:vancomycin resistance protein YoaR